MILILGVLLLRLDNDFRLMLFAFLSHGLKWLDHWFW
jgi:hypothetical protein